MAQQVTVRLDGTNYIIPIYYDNLDTTVSQFYVKDEAGNDIIVNSDISTKLFSACQGIEALADLKANFGGSSSILDSISELRAQLVEIAELDDTLAATREVYEAAVIGASIVSAPSVSDVVNVVEYLTSAYADGNLNAAKQYTYEWAKNVLLASGTQLMVTEAYLDDIGYFGNAVFEYEDVKNYYINGVRYTAVAQATMDAVREYIPAMNGNAVAEAFDTIIMGLAGVLPGEVGVSCTITSGLQGIIDRENKYELVNKFNRALESIFEKAPNYFTGEFVTESKRAFESLSSSSRVTDEFLLNLRSSYSVSIEGGDTNSYDVNIGNTEWTGSFDFDSPFSGFIQLVARDGTVVRKVTCSGASSKEISYSGMGSYTVEITNAGRAIVGFDIYTDQVTEVTIESSITDDVEDDRNTTHTLAADNDCVFGEVDTETDQDWYKVELSANKIYTIEVEGHSSATPLELESLNVSVKDASGSVLQGCIGADGGWDAQFEYTPESSGTYYISIDGTESGIQSLGDGWKWYRGFGGYALSIESEDLPVVAADEYGDEVETAEILNDSSSLITTPIIRTGAIQTLRDDDAFQVYLEAGKTYQASVLAKDSGMGSLDDPDIDWVAVDGDHFRLTGHDEAELFTPETSGTYYFMVDSEGDAGRTGSYTIEVRAYDPSVDDYAANTLTNGTISTDGTAITAMINSNSDTDWFKVDLDLAHDVSGYRTGDLVSYRFHGNEAGSSPATDVDELGVYASTGELLNDDKIYSTYESGQVFVEIGADGPGTYTLYTSHVYLDDAGNSVSTALDLTAGTTASPSYTTGTLEISQDEDWYSVWLEGGTIYQIDALGAATGQGTGTYFDVKVFYTGTRHTSGNYSDSAYDGGVENASGENVSFDFLAPESGLYHVSINVDGDGTTGTYALGVNELTGSDDITSRSNAPTIGAGGEQSAKLDFAGDEDWFKITTSSSNFYELRSSDSGNYLDGVYLQVVDGSGNLIEGINDNELGASTIYLGANISSGTYYVRAFAAPEYVDFEDCGIGAYDVSLTAESLSDWNVGSTKNVAYNSHMDDQYFNVSLVEGHVYEVQVTSSDGAEMDQRDVDFVGSDLEKSSVIGAGTGYSTYQIVADETRDVTVRISPDDATVSMKIADLGVQDAYAGTALQATEFFGGNNAAIKRDAIGFDSSNLQDFDTWYFDAEAGKSYQFTLTDESGGAAIDSSFYLSIYGLETLTSTWSESSRVAAFTASSDARYYVRVESPRDATEANYRLIGQRSNSTSITDDYRSDNLTTGSLSPTGDTPDVISGNFEMDGDSDWYAIDLTAGNSYLFSTTAGDVTVYYQEDTDRDPYRNIVSSPLDGIQCEALTDGIKLFSRITETVYVSVAKGTSGASSYDLTAMTKKGGDSGFNFEMQSLVITTEDSGAVSLGASEATVDDGDTLTITINALPGYGQIKLGDTTVGTDTVLTASMLDELTFTPDADFFGDAGDFSITISDGWGNTQQYSTDFTVLADLTDGDEALTSLDFEHATSGIILDLESGTLEEGLNGQRNLEDGVLSVTGTSFSDRVVTSSQGNFVNVGGGDDYVAGGTGCDIVLGGEGADTLLGGAGSDFLYSGDGDDVVNGGEGDDNLVGGSGLGDDIYSGGPGSDTVIYTSAVSSISVDLTLGSAFGEDIGNDTLVGIENVIAGSGDDLIRGDGANNNLSGDGGADTLEGLAGNDTLNGNAGNDLLAGGNGDDFLSGGDGDDSYAFTGVWGADTISDTGGSVSFSGLNSSELHFSIADDADLVITSDTNSLLISDYLTSADTYTFTADDGSFDIPFNGAPLTAAVDGNIGMRQNVAASTLFSASDPDSGDTIERYQFWDNDQDTQSGHFTLNGTAQSACQILEVSASQLGSVGFTGGSADGATDSLYVRAFDGTEWGGWANWTMTSVDANLAPVAAADNGTINAGQSVVASTLFSASDPNSGDAIERYQFWDNDQDTQSGHFTLNGTAQPACQILEVSASQLGSVGFTGGSADGATDSLYVRAFDGTEWGGWANWTMTSVDANQAPVTAADNGTINAGQSVAASTLFSASDPNSGDAIERYQFWDNDQDTQSGHFTLNGTAQPACQILEILASQLGSVGFTGGSADGATDSLYVRAFDGTEWGGWANWIMTSVDANQAPVTAADNGTINAGQSVAASTLFSASDPNSGDTIERYQFWDNDQGAQSGHFTLNGSTQPACQILEVLASQLGSVGFTGGSADGATDSLYVRAFDGTEWGGWANWTMTSVDANLAPVAAADNGTINAGQSVVASTLFSASDPNSGDTIERYQFWDNDQDAQSGHFTLNGSTQPACQILEVLASQLGSVGFTGGSMDGAADSLYVRAFDGTEWGGWANWTMTSVDANQAPVTAADNGTINAGQSVAASTLFSASDPNSGDTIERYQFWDNDQDAQSGHFTLNGSTQPACQILEVLASQLGSVGFTGGSMDGAADTLYVRGFDGTAWGEWVSWEMTTTDVNQSPIVTVKADTQSLLAGESVAAKWFFDASDPNASDSIERYQFWDNNQDTQSGHFTVNGIAQSACQLVEVMASSLNQIVFTSGSSGTSDILYARAFDGEVWGDWSQWTANSLDDAPSNTTSQFQLSPGQSRTGSLDASDSDCFSAFLDAGQQYVAEAFGSGHDLLTHRNTYLDLLNGSGSTLASDDNSGTGYDARMTFTAAYTGIHHLKVSSVGETSGTYELSLAKV